jgi:hypothetical protein
MPSSDPNDPDSARTFEFAFFADYYQLYVEDCRLASELDQREGEDPDAHVARIDAYAATVLSPDAYARQLGVTHGTLCLLTKRNFTVPLTISLRANAPTDDFTSWDRVIEARLDVPSGCIVVHGPSDYFPEAPRVTVAPGVYRARVCYGGLATVSADEMEGEDRYCIELWPDLDVSAEPVVLHPRATA